MLEKYLDSQEIVTKLLLNSLNNNRLSQAYLFVCDDIDYIFYYSKDFVKEIIKKSNLSQEKLDNIFNRIDKNEYNELKIIESQGQFIKKEQLIELQNSVQNKPVEANKIVYIIKNAEKLNSSSANCILKFLEEPSDDIIALLLTNNLNMVLPTIKSRCQILNFKNEISILNDEDRLKRNLFIESLEKDDEEIENIINKCIFFIENLESKKLSTVIYIKELLWDNFKTNEDINILFGFMTYLYIDSIYKIMNKDIKYMNKYINLIDLIIEKNEINDIITKINIIENLKLCLKSNVNSKLIFDKIIIEFSEV